MEITVELDKALSTLYGNTTPQLKNDANNFLLEFQKSLNSWDVIFSILTPNNEQNKQYSQELKLFICQTLKSKTQYDFGQLPDSSIPLLRNLILNYLNSLNNYNNDKLLIIQLSIALSYLTIQDLNWIDPINEILNKLSNNLLNLLEFLKILPEELNDPTKLPLNSDEYEIQFNKLTSNSQNIYFILSQYASSNNIKDDNIKILILQCIKSWINEIPINLLLNNENNSIWLLILNGFNNDETFDTSIDCLITIINQIDIFDNLHNNLQFINIIYQQLILFKPLIIENWDDPIIIERFTELFSITGEMWHTLIVKDPNSFQDLIEIILKLTNYNDDLDIVKYTFKFWYELKSMLILNKFHESKKIFKPIFQKLMEILINHLKYPIISNSTNISILFNNNKEDEDKFKDFRYEIGDVLKDCCLVIGQYDSLNIPFLKLKSLIENTNNETIKWQEIECLLFAIRSMAKEINKNENEILPQIMNYLIQLPENPKIRYAATLVLGRYTIWTSQHPEFLQIELNYIIEGFKLNNEIYNYNEDEKLQIIIATSHALKYFCMDCNNLLINYLEPLYNLYSNIENYLDIKSLEDITEGLSYVLNHFIKENLINNGDQCINLIQMFWKNTLLKLNNSLNDDINNDNNILNICNLLDILSIYIDNLKPPHEFLKLKDSNYIISTFIINEIFPIIFNIFNKFGKLSKISEKLIKFIRKCIQNFKRFILPSLTDIENLLIEGFKNFKFGCYLWCSGTLIKEFSDDGNDNIDDDEFIKLTPDILNNIWTFSLNQIEILINIYENNFNELNIDILEDFYRMLNDILMFKPIEFLNNFKIVEIIYKISIELIDKFNEFELLNLIINYLTDLLSWSLENPPISIYFEIPNILKIKIFNLLKENNNELIIKFLNYSILKFNEDLIYSSIELIVEIFQINNYYQQIDVNLNSINIFLNSLPIELISDNEKVKFFKNLEISINSKNLRKTRSNLLDFIHWYKRKIINRV